MSSARGIPSDAHRAAVAARRDSLVRHEAQRLRSGYATKAARDEGRQRVNYEDLQRAKVWASLTLVATSALAMITEKRKAHALDILRRVMPPVIQRWRQRMCLKATLAAVTAARECKPTAHELRDASVLFTDFPDYVMQRLQAGLVACPCAEGDILIPFGTSTHDVYYIAAGHIRIDYPKKVGRDPATASPGCVIGEMSAFIDGHQPLRYRCAEQAFLWRILAHDYAEALRLLPPKVHAAAAVMAQQQKADSGLTSLEPLRPKDLKHATPALLKGLDGRTLQLLIEAAQPRPVAEGTVIVRSGAIVSSLMLLVKGEAVVEGVAAGYRAGPSEAGRAKPLALGSWIGSEVLTCCRLHTRTVVARTPCGCWVIPKEVAVEILTSPRESYVPSQFLAIRQSATEHLVGTALPLTAAVLSQATATLLGIPPRAWRMSGMPRCLTHFFAKADCVLARGETSRASLLILSAGRLCVDAADGTTHTVDSQCVLNPVDGMLNAPSRQTIRVASPYALVWRIPLAGIRCVHATAFAVAVEAAAKMYASDDSSDAADRLKRAVLATPQQSASAPPRGQPSLPNTLSTSAITVARPPLSRTVSVASTQVSHDSSAAGSARVVAAPPSDAAESNAAPTPQSLPIVHRRLPATLRQAISPTPKRPRPPADISLPAADADEVGAAAALATPMELPACRRVSDGTTGSSPSVDPTPRQIISPTADRLSMRQHTSSSSRGDLTAATSVYFARGRRRTSVSCDGEEIIVRRRGGICAANMPSPFPTRDTEAAERELRLNPMSERRESVATDVSWLVGSVGEALDIPTHTVVEGMEIEALMRVAERRAAKAFEEKAPPEEKVLDWGGEWTLPSAAALRTPPPSTSPAFDVPHRYRRQGGRAGVVAPVAEGAMLPPVGSVQSVLLQRLVGSATFAPPKPEGFVGSPGGTREEASMLPSAVCAPSPVPPSREHSFNATGVSELRGDPRDPRAMQLVFPAPGFLYADERNNVPSPTPPGGSAATTVTADARAPRDHIAAHRVPGTAADDEHDSDSESVDAGGAELEDAAAAVDDHDGEAAVQHAADEPCRALPHIDPLGGAVSSHAAVGFEGGGGGAVVHEYGRVPPSTVAAIAAYVPRPPADGRGKAAPRQSMDAPSLAESTATTATTATTWEGSSRLSRTSTTLSVGLVPQAQPYGPVLENGDLALPYLSAVFERQIHEEQAKRSAAFRKAHRPAHAKVKYVRARAAPPPTPNDELWGRLTNTPVSCRAAAARPRRRRRPPMPDILSEFL